MGKLAFNVQLWPAAEFQLGEAYIPVSLSVLNEINVQAIKDRWAQFTFAARVYLTADWSILFVLGMMTRRIETPPLLLDTEGTVFPKHNAARN